VIEPARVHAEAAAAIKLQYHAPQYRQRTWGLAAHRRERKKLQGTRSVGYRRRATAGGTGRSKCRRPSSMFGASALMCLLLAGRSRICMEVAAPASSRPVWWVETAIRDSED
jgi:hypothetical protein